MRSATGWVVGIAIALGGAGWARADERVVSSADEQTLIGEVASLWCYVYGMNIGTSRSNASGQMNCIRWGSPIAIKVGKQFYVVSDPDTALRNRLMLLAGSKVSARGTLTKDDDGRLAIRLSHVERAGKHARAQGPSLAGAGSAAP